MTGTVATSLISGDRIMLSVTAKRPNGQRVNINATFNEAGQQVDAAGETVGGPGLNIAATASPEPEFPTSEYRALVQQNKKAEADALSVAYKRAYDAWGAGAGQTGSFAERLNRAVYAFLQSAHGVSSEDHDGLVLRQDQVMARIPLRETPTSPAVFTIQLAPVWG